MKINKEATNYYDLLTEEEEQKLVDLFLAKSLDFRIEADKVLKKATEELRSSVFNACYDYKENLEGFDLHSSLRDALVQFMLDNVRSGKSIFYKHEAKKLREKMFEENKEWFLEHLEKDLVERLEHAEKEAKRYEELYYERIRY
jgi:hypothetical protein